MTEYELLREDWTGEIRTYVKPDGVPIPEITTVYGWTPFWSTDDGHFQPEMKVIDAANPNYLAPVMRLNAAGRGIKAFKQWGQIDCGYYRQVAVPAGIDMVQAVLRGHCWYSKANDPEHSVYNDDQDNWLTVTEGMRLWVGLDLGGGTDPWADSVEWSWQNIFDAHDFVYLSVADPGPLVTVFIRADNDYGFLHVDAYFASLDLYGYSDDPEPLPPSGCRGGPRDQYARLVNVVPKEADRERYREIAEIAWERGRQTITGSYDDAGIGDLDDRIAVLWDLPTSRFTEFSDWYALHYPGVTVRFSGTNPEPFPDPEPEPEPTPDPPPSTGAGFENLPKALSAGLHFTAGPPGKLPDNSPAVELPDTSKRYISEGKPSIVKGVSGGDVYRVGKYARQYSPGTRTVWRRVVGDGNYITGNLRDQAQRYLDQYIDESETASHNLGITMDEFWNHIDYIGGLNELISNWGGNTETQVEFECNLADLVDAQIQHNTKVTMLAVAIGNPSHEPADILRMLPAAQMSAEHGHVLDYHAYWTAGHEPGLSYLDREWEWHAGRWIGWDEVFAANGVAPTYMFGESGMVYDPTDGTWLGSGRAWRDAGSILYFLDQIKRMNTHVRDWNATHGNRCLGGVLFTCEYSWGWDEFLLGTGELLEILKWMRTL